MEGRVVADSCMNLTEGNIFKKSVRFTPMVCACKFLESIRQNLLTVDHHEVEFVQRGTEVVRRESKSVNEVVDRIVMRCEDEQLGAFLVAANLSSHAVRQSSSHSDDITDVLWRKFVAPSGQAGIGSHHMRSKSQRNWKKRTYPLSKTLRNQLNNNEKKTNQRRG